MARESDTRGRRWISPRETAEELLGVHVQTVYDWVSSGLIPNARIGRKVLIDRRRLEDKLETEAVGQDRGRR